MSTNKDLPMHQEPVTEEELKRVRNLYHRQGQYEHWKKHEDLMVKTQPALVKAVADLDDKMHKLTYAVKELIGATFTRREGKKAGGL